MGLQGAQPPAGASRPSCSGGVGPGRDLPPAKTLCHCPSRALGLWPRRGDISPQPPRDSQTPAGRKPQGRSTWDRQRTRENRIEKPCVLK